MIITRFHNMEKLDVAVEFLTPTFLGGADQQAELRSAQIKNLLRQWWRVRNGILDEKELRSQEGNLFGTVRGDDVSSASKVRISIVPGEPFSISDAAFSFGSTEHPEVKGGMLVKNSLYLGYGPVMFAKPEPKCRKYIKPGSMATLSITFPRQNRAEIISILQLIDAFGTIGSRSRNGYGSLALTAEELTILNPATLHTVQIKELVEVSINYPNRFGRDKNGLLLWDSLQQNKWESAMQLLAGTYMGVRTKINIKGNPKDLHERHALGYPVTNHNVSSWGDGNGRMPSQLRLMVKRNQNNQLVARILHLPHRLPKQWLGNLPPQIEVWREVHQFLDAQKDNFKRIGGGA